MEQPSFLFDQPLDHDPVSQLAPRAPRGDKELFEARLRSVLNDLPDDIECDDPLIAIGLPVNSLEGWHRARSLAVLVGGLAPPFQAYHPDPDSIKLRFRRNPPLECCPGFEDESCTLATPGGIRCSRHAEMEREDLFNTP